MKTVRLIFRLFGIISIIAGFNSCKKEKDDAGRHCSGEEFTCTYSYNDGSSYSYRFCQDGWSAYYSGNTLYGVYFDVDYTTYWNDYKDYWAYVEEMDNYLNCVF